MSDKTRLRLRLLFGADMMFGPGKADLLALIASEGSISAAGRQMGMSYKRAWTLVEEMNAAFRDPLVASVRGGPKGGGARLTKAGAKVLAQYRQLEATVAQTGAAEIAAIRAMLRDMSGEK
jgi:molybdate transport system regulatory protein